MELAGLKYHDLNQARRLGAGGGANTSALAFGGFNPPPHFTLKQNSGMVVLGQKFQI